MIVKVLISLGTRVWDGETIQIYRQGKMCYLLKYATPTEQLEGNRNTLASMYLSTPKVLSYLVIHYHNVTGCKA